LWVSFSMLVGFCYDMARQDPSLVVPHLPTLSVLLSCFSVSGGRV
jgi:hypothetical protein